MATSFQRPALRATGALLRSHHKAPAVSASVGTSFRASLTTATATTCRAEATSRSLAGSKPTRLYPSPAAIARSWYSSRHGLAATWAACRAFSSSAPAGESKIYSFEEVKKVTETPDSPIVIIDAREPAELKDTGRIPGAINIPVSSAPDSFFIPEEEFEDRFGFHRPGPDTEVLFYCKAGVRSRAAAGLAREAGWTKVGEYPGSWLDWAGKGGAVQR